MNHTERPRPSWDEYGMMLAHAASLRSPDPHHIVGAAGFRKDHSTVATGYNGALPDTEIDWTNREARRPHVIHAEANCLKYAKPGEIHYLYVTLLPCAVCLENIALHGVKEIIYDQIYKRDASTLDKAADYGIVLKQLTLKPNESDT